MSKFVARAEVDVAAPADRVWAALTQPEQIAAYMQGSRVTTTWEVGTPISWEGQYEGHPYTDKGEILTYNEPFELSMTHYSPLMGEPDEPDKYHTLVYTLTTTGSGTHIALSQDGNDSEEQAEQFSSNWQSMLNELKAHVEG